MTKRNLVVVLTTVADGPEDEAMAHTLVEERLAACVNQASVRSTYRWQGRIESDDERLLVIKTARDLLPRLVARVAELSSYDVAEFVVLESATSSASYLAWVLESCPPVG